MRRRTKFILGLTVASLALVATGWSGGSLQAPFGLDGGKPAATSSALSRAQLAQAVLDNPNITFATGDPATQYKANVAKQAVELTAQGQKAPVPEKGTSVYLSPKLLELMLLLAQKYHIGIGFITNGKHVSTSHHYQGRAFDIDVLNGTTITGPTPAVRALAQYAANQLTAGGEIGQRQCLGTLHIPPGVNYVTDDCDHLHVAVGT